MAVLRFRKSAHFSPCPAAMTRAGRPRHEKGAGLLRPLPVLRADRSAAVGGTRGGGLRHHLAVDHRQAVAGLLVHADGLLGAFVAVGHVVAHGLVLRAQRDAAAGLAAHAHGAGAAVRVAVGHVVADHVAGLGRVGHGVALALGAVHHPAADVVAVDAVADVPAGHGAGRGRDLPAVAATDLVADQAADDRAGDRTADVAVALGQALLHHDVVADLARRRSGRGFAHRIGADDGGVELLGLPDRLDGHHVGIGHAAAVGDAVVERRRVVAGQALVVEGARRGGGAGGVRATGLLERGDGNAAHQQCGDGNGDGVLVHEPLLTADSPALVCLPIPALPA